MTMNAVDQPSPKGRKGGFARSKAADQLTKVIVIAVTVLALIYILLPVYWMVKSSFQTTADIRAMPQHWFPREITFQAYQDMGLVIPIWRYILNSIYVSAAAAVLSTLVGKNRCTIKFPVVVGAINRTGSRYADPTAGVPILRTES